MFLDEFQSVALVYVCVLYCCMDKVLLLIGDGYIVTFMGGY